LPPGNSHFSPSALPARRWQISTLASRSMIPATTRIIVRPHYHANGRRLYLLEKSWTDSILWLRKQMTKEYRSVRPWMWRRKLGERELGLGSVTRRVALVREPHPSPPKPREEPRSSVARAGPELSPMPCDFVWWNTEHPHARRTPRFRPEAPGKRR